MDRNARLDRLLFSGQDTWGCTLFSISSTPCLHASTCGQVDWRRNPWAVLDCARVHALEKMAQQSAQMDASVVVT